ncbi:MAG TPA: GH3 auxin-responsive promoter family protein, partial [Clostridiaceae bacterium]
ERHGIKEGFFMIAPETDRYVLYIEAGKETGGIGDRIEETLRENFHYDYCRKLGQLKHLKIFKLTGDPEKEYIEECMRRGQRLGDIKPSVLHLKGGWDNVFKGEYA